MTNRWLGATDVPRGDDYDARFTALAQRGEDVHGEAHFVQALHASPVLDAGCGTGRVAIELARRGVEVVGVDLDTAMLDVARRKAPELTWYADDLATMSLMMPTAPSFLRQFEAIVLAGNVMIFLAPGSEPTVVANLARHLCPGGALVAGFQLHPGGLTVTSYDHYATQAGLRLVERWGTWDRQPWYPTSTYTVSVHRRIV